MKKILKLAIFAIGLIAVATSCDKDDPSGESKPDVPVQKSWNASFDAIVGQNVSLSAAVSEGDAISVFSGNKNQTVEAASVGEGGNTAVFSGTVLPSDAFYALYPYSESASFANAQVTATVPQEQTLTAGALDPAARMYLAKASGADMKFAAAFAVMSLKVKGAEVAAMTLSSTNEEDRLVGKAKVNIGTGKMTVVSGSNFVTLKGAPAAGTAYYVSLLPGEFAGLKVAGVNEAGLTAEVTLSAEKCTFEKGKIKEFEVDFTDAEWILRPLTGMSYELKSAQEVTEFAKMKPTPKEEVVSLTLSGKDITDQHVAMIADRVGTVSESIVWDNIGATTTAGFFDVITCAKNVTLKNCSDLADVSGFDGYTSIGGDLVIENCPALQQGWPALESVAGAFKVSGSSVLMGQEQSFAALKTVGGNFSVENMPETFTSFKGLQLQTISGDLTILNNPGLVDLTGLDRLASVGGNVLILDNQKLTTLSEEDIKGYCLVRELINARAVSTSADIRLGKTDALVDIATLPSCDGTLPGEPQSYVLNGKAEVQRFVSGASGVLEVVKNLKISGADVDNEVLHSLSQRVEKIIGTITLENISWIEDPNSEAKWGIGTAFLEPFITSDGVFEGGIVMRNVAGIINVNGFSNMREIKGDFVVENCPNFQIHDWEDATNKLRKVGGDFRRIVCDDRGISGTFLAALEEVGGDFEMAGFNNFSSLEGTKIRSIGGDFIIRDCPNFLGLNGLENLTWLGGNVLISNYGALPLRSGVVDGRNALGICHFRDLMLNAMMEEDAQVIIVKDEETLDFSTVASCSAVLDEDELAGNEKFPNPEEIAGWNK